MTTRVAQVRAAAALCALTAVSMLAHAQKLCDSVQIGNETRTTFSLEERRVEPDMFRLEINEVDVCPDSEVVGLKVTACDREQAPHVLLMDTARGMVARTGPAASEAFVYVTVYCTDANELEGDAAESPSVANRFSEQALLPSSPISHPTVTSIFTQTLDSLLPPEVEPPSVKASSMDEYLPPVKLESRFSSPVQSSIPTSLSSMLKNRLKERVTPSLGLVGTASRLTKKYEPSINSLLLNGVGMAAPSSSLSDTSSLVKHLKAFRPKQPSALLKNRSPAWLQRLARRPLSSWLKLRSLPDGRTRSSYRPASRSYDYEDA